jgi:hypothetical protein
MDLPRTSYEIFISPSDDDLYVLDFVGLYGVLRFPEMNDLQDENEIAVEKH